MKRAVLIFILAVAGLTALAFLPVGPDTAGEPEGPAASPAKATSPRDARGAPVELTTFSPEALVLAEPGARVPLLFIHHSCGGQLFAPPGPESGDSCIYGAHPNGGDLRARLEANGYEIHEASFREPGILY